MNLERIYCYRFFRKNLEFDRITAKIFIFEDDANDSDYISNFKVNGLNNTIELKERGYPEPIISIHSICQDYKNHDEKFDGKKYRSILIKCREELVNE